MTKAVIGLLGCGVVGGGVADRLLREPAVSDTALTLARTLVRDVAKDRFPSVVRPHLTALASDVLDDPSVDVVVECIGGVHPAFAYVETALRGGKHVVTANKALIAEHGEHLARVAATRGLDLRYEAAVGGAIPMVRSLRHLVTTDEVSEIAGIVNGTTNYILSAMEDGTDFDQALSAAQRNGFAETDASYDVDGIDAAQKLTILTATGFGVWPRWDDIERRGVRGISANDVALAKRLGCRIKLVARAVRDGADVKASVSPVLVSYDHPFAAARGPENVIRIIAKHAGPLIFSGLGAGRSATASAIFSDLADLVAVHRIGSIPAVTV